MRDQSLGDWRQAVEKQLETFRSDLSALERREEEVKSRLAEEKEKVTEKGDLIQEHAKWINTL